MMIENDFEMEGGERRPDEPASPLPTPLVVIHYRNRGIPLALIPPVLVLAAILGFYTHQRMTPPRRSAAPRHEPVADVGQPLEMESMGVIDSPPLFFAKGDLPAVPEPAPVLGGFPPPRLFPELVASPAPEPSLDAPDAGDDRDPPQPESGPDSPASDAPPESSDPVAIAPELDPGPVPGPPPPRPALTKEQIMDDIRREGEQKATERRNLEAWKPQLLQKDRELSQQVREMEVAEVRRLAESKRVEFHAELRKLINALGDRAGPRINGLCEEYGRVTMPEIYKAFEKKLRRTSARLGRQEKVELMRRLGLPEPIILDAIARDASRSLNTRGGPRNMDEVRVLAGRQLLAIPPNRRGRTTAKPVTATSIPPVPVAGRRPQ